MGLKQWALSKFSSREGEASVEISLEDRPRKSIAAEVRLNQLAASLYDVAGDGTANAKHWNSALAISAREANDPATREILRNRARYEVANNAYARGITDTVADDIVGTGPRLQLTNSDLPPLDTHKAERLFGEWCETIDLAHKLRLLRIARIVDGEGFGIMATRESSASPVKLDLFLVETDRVTDPTDFDTDPNRVDGIDFDQQGQPTRYRILDRHPDDRAALGVWDEGKFYRADRVVHYFKADRLGQVRGIPELTPSLPLFAHLRRYTLATIGAAEAVANVAGFISQQASDDPGSYNEGEVFDLPANSWLTLGEGQEPKQIKAEQPTTTYPGFKVEILNEIARALGVPENVARGSSKEYNYASGRLDFQHYHRRIQVERAILRRIILDRLTRAWFEEAVLLEDYLPDSIRQASLELRWEWHFDGFTHVDPAKEATAQEKRLNNNTTTHAREYAALGLDWEVEFVQRAKELAKMEELGITPAQAAPTPAAAPAARPDDDDDDDQDGGDDVPD